MMHSDAPSAPVEVAKAVAIAALTCLATKLVEWALDEVRARVRGEPKRPAE